MPEMSCASDVKFTAAMVLTMAITALHGARAAEPIKLWDFDTSGYTPAWRVLTDGVPSTPAVSNDGKVVYVGGTDNQLYALNTVAGTRLWSFATGRGGLSSGVSSPALSSDGTVVYIGSSDRRLYAVDAATGSGIWSFATGSDVDSDPAVSSDGNVVYIGSDDRSLYAVDALTGGRLWNFPTGDCIRSSPAVNSVGDVVYVGSNDNNLYAFNTGRGTKRWSFETGGHVQSSPALSHDGTAVYVGSDDTNLYAIDALNGSKIWSFATGYAVRASPTLSSDGKAVYVGNGNANILYAVDAVTGRKIWSFATGDAVRSSPALSSDGKVVYVGSDDGNLRAVDASTGSEIWSFPTGGSMLSSPALSGDGKALYVGSISTGLHAIVDNCYQEACSARSRCMNSRTGYTCDCDAGYTAAGAAAFVFPGALPDCKPSRCSSAVPVGAAYDSGCDNLVADSQCIHNCSAGYASRDGKEGAAGTKTYTCPAGVFRGTLLDCEPNVCTDLVPRGKAYNAECQGLVSGGNCVHTCANGFEDVAAPQGRTYTCPYGLFTGTQLDCGAVDYCTNVTCSSHGTCVNGNSGYSCSCSKGYSGKTCAWHMLPLFACGIAGGVFTVVALYWLLRLAFCLRKPGDIYHSSAYSQIQNPCPKEFMLIDAGFTSSQPPLLSLYRLPTGAKQYETRLINGGDAHLQADSAETRLPALDFGTRFNPDVIEQRARIAVAAERKYGVTNGDAYGGFDKNQIIHIDRHYLAYNDSTANRWNNLTVGGVGPNLVPNNPKTLN